VSSSPPIGRKPGRPRDQILDAYRQLFPEWSERTLARYAKARRYLVVAGFTIDEQREFTKRATRPNGTVAVQRFEEIAETVALMRAIEGGRQ
jgi:hypothetical protein